LPRASKGHVNNVDVLCADRAEIAKVWRRTQQSVVEEKRWVFVSVIGLKQVSSQEVTDKSAKRGRANAF
jgi:hypothetical protein